MTTSLPVNFIPSTVDAATLRRWANRLMALNCPDTGLCDELAATAEAIEQAEAAYADYLDGRQPRADHPFGCECSECTASVVLTEAARTGEAS